MKKVRVSWSQRENGAIIIKSYETTMDDNGELGKAAPVGIIPDIEEL